MTNCYTEEQRELAIRALPNIWVEAFYLVLRLRRNSPVADYRAAYNLAQKLITYKWDTQETWLTRSIWLDWAVAEMRKTRLTHELQAEVVYGLIQALYRYPVKHRQEALADACRTLGRWTNIRRVIR